MRPKEEDFDFVAYKQERLAEIALVIKESGRRLKIHDTGFDEILKRIEKLKRENPWLE
jgi:hypothetical protein